MTVENRAILTKPFADLRIKQGAPPIERPPKEEMEAYPQEAKERISDHIETEKTLLQSNNFKLDSLKGKHFLLAGATGPGLGGALATALLHQLKDAGSITVVGRDIRKTLGYYMGLELQAVAEDLGYGNRFHLLNDGLAQTGNKLGKILTALKEAEAEDIIYINTVASASSGLLPDAPPIYVKDIDEEGLFQWELTPLDERSIEATKNVMGHYAIDFPKILENEGFTVSAQIFADWRGSLDKTSQDPRYPEYGRQGAYSTSLHLPKNIIQDYVSKNYSHDKIIIDGFFPIMRTRALSYIPGGMAMSSVYGALMEKANVRRIEIPELALRYLDYIGQTINGKEYNPFPRFDMHEAALEQWFYEVVLRMNQDEKSDFYYKKWLSQTV